MNESEARRAELLKRTKKLYNDDRFVPAVHPRYGHIYKDLYAGEQKERPKGSFFFRLTLGVLCFLCFVWMDYGNISVANVSSSRIINQIEKQFDWKDIREVWKKL